ncbi:MAG: DUF4340 domain-containing protein [Acidobacteriota bacterium]|nr:DUF4340 domain-containing protein [Acidobacteriota bacterium]
MKFKTTIILLVIFILALAGVLLVEHNSKIAKEKKEKTELLTDLKVSDVEKLQLINSDQTTITIQKDEKGNWQVIEPLVTEADSYEVNNLVETLAGLRIEHLVDNQPADLKEYGFPQKEIKIWLKEQSEPISILTGMENPLDGTLYARRADETRVVLLPAYVKTSLDKKLFDLRNKNILKFEPKEVQSLELSSRELAWKLIKKGDDFYLISPVEALASSSQIDSILNNLSALKARNFLAEDKKLEDLKAYGLHPPEYTIRLMLANGQEIILSLRKKEETVIATTSLLAKIVQVDNQIINDICKKASELREKRIAQFNSWRATALTIKRGSESFSLVKEKSGDKDKPEDNWYLITQTGQKELAEASQAESLLRQLEYLEAIDFIDRPQALEAYGLDKPQYEIIIKVKAEDDKEKTIKLFFGQKLKDKNQVAVKNSDFAYLFLIDFNLLSSWPSGVEDFKLSETKK